MVTGMNPAQSIVVRKLLLRLEHLCVDSLGHSSFSSARVAEVMAKTLENWGTPEWSKLSTMLGIAGPLGFVDRGLVVRTFQARARILRLVSPRYRVTYFALAKRCVLVEYFNDPIAACEFASQHSLNGMEPAPVDVIEPLQQQA